MEKLTGSKAELRRAVLERRKHLSGEETAAWDRQILERLLLLQLENMAGGSEENAARAVYCYISVRGETGTEAIIRHYLEQGLCVAVPRVCKKDMDFYYIRDFSDLEPGGFGIPEPKSYCEKAGEKNAPVIVPGVAFSRRFERAGYGAGFYDRFFAREPEHEKIAVCYDFQLVEAMASEPHDVYMDRVITPGRALCREEKRDAD